MTNLSRSHFGPTVAENNGLKIIDCKVCGYAHLKSLPSQEELDRYYNEDEFYNQHSGGNAWFEKNKLEHANGYWKAQYDYQRNMLYGSLLDYGCGDGYFLQNYKNGIGVEPSAMARSYAPSGLAIFDGLEYLKNSAFDNVRMALVLEHILTPYELVYSLMNYAKPTFTIQIVVPNEFNPLQKKVEKRHGSSWYVQKPHLNYFSKNAIKLFIQRCGFYITDESATFPMELFYLMGYKYIGNDEIGKSVHLMRLNFEKRFGINAYKLYRVLYRKLGWGRESIITASYGGL